MLRRTLVMMGVGFVLVALPGLGQDNERPLVVGILGASNSQGARSWIVQFRELCPQARVFSETRRSADSRALRRGMLTRLQRQVRAGLQEFDDRTVDLAIINPGRQDVGYNRPFDVEARALVQATRIRLGASELNYIGYPETWMIEHPTNDRYAVNLDLFLRWARARRSGVNYMAPTDRLIFATNGCRTGRFCRHDAYHWNTLGSRRVAAAVFIESILRRSISSSAAITRVPRRSADWTSFVQAIRATGQSCKQLWDGARRGHTVSGFFGSQL